MAINMKGLNLKRMLAQRVIPRLEGGRLGDKSYFDEVIALVDAGVGGFVLFGGDYWEVRKAIPRLQARAKIPLIIASDMERGAGQQLAGATSFPCQMAVAAATDLVYGEGIGLVTEMLDAVALEASGAGVNAVLTPVLDVNSNPYNPIICTRAFSDEPTTVSALGELYVKGLQGSEQPVMACAKHFPGHGETVMDSHVALPVVDKDKDNLEEQDMLPFRKAIMAGVEMVMTGHLMVPDIDPEYPASLSHRHTRVYLRNRAGFGGLVVTDALSMGALTERFSPGEAARLAIKAGADLLLHPAEPLAFLDALYEMAKDKDVTKEDVMAPAARIQRAKARFCTARPRLVDAKLKEQMDRNGELADTIAQRAITLVKAGGAFPVLKDLKGPVAHIVLEEDGDRSAGRVIRGSFARRKDTTNLFVTKDKADALRDEAMKRAADSALTVVSVFSKVSAGKGGSGLSPQLADLGRRLARVRKRGTVAISFGSPYVLKGLMDAEHVVAAYDPSDAMQEALIRAFKGEIIFRGELPVRI